MSLQLAAASYVCIDYTFKEKEKKRTAVTCHVASPELLRP